MGRRRTDEYLYQRVVVADLTDASPEVVREELRKVTVDAHIAEWTESAQRLLKDVESGARVRERLVQFARQVVNHEREMRAALERGDIIAVRDEAIAFASAFAMFQHEEHLAPAAGNYRRRVGSNRTLNERRHDRSAAYAAPLQAKLEALRAAGMEESEARAKIRDNLDVEDPPEWWSGGIDRWPPDESWFRKWLR